MRRLFHMPLDPACRLARIALAEKGLPVQLVPSPPWGDNGDLVAVNPAGSVPVLIDEPPTGGQIAVSPTLAIVEYLEEAYSSIPLYPSSSAARAEVRRLCFWFTEKFETDVIVPIVRERIDKRLQRAGQPDFELVKRGADACSWHMDYFSWLLETRPWFAGEKYTLADVAAAAYLSAVDYVDAVQWDQFNSVRDWYAKVKSRPSLRLILRDRIDGLPPPSHYDDPDF